MAATGQIGSLLARLAGPAVAALILALGPQPVPSGGLPAEGLAAAAVAAWMALWWMTEAVPLPVTALLPILLFPLLGVASLEQAAAPFANPVIFLFLGGFWIALAMQRWGLHRRIALAVMRRVGRRPRALIGGLMAATALCSMWVSNTATAMMMLPIATSLLAGPDDGEQPSVAATNLANAMLLGVAYAASIGGLATLVGSPPNALAAGYLAQTFDIHIGFAGWMAFGVPLTLVLLPLCWLVLTRIAFRVQDDPEIIRAGSLGGLEAAPAMALPERRLTILVAAVAVLLLAQPLLASLAPRLPLGDTAIMLSGACLLFALPAGDGSGARLLDWHWAKQAPWDILLLFGGGLSLARAVDATGLAAWIGDQLDIVAGMSPALVVLAVVLLIIFLTELTSNTATASTFLPIVGALAVAVGLQPAELAVPAALAASCAFMLPVATPPNAIVFGSGRVAIGRMMRAGIWMNLIATLAITVGAVLLVGGGWRG